MINLKCILVFIIVFLTFVPWKRKEHFLVPNNIQSDPEKAGSIKKYHTKDDYSYRLLDMHTKEMCYKDLRNLSDSIKHHKPDPRNAGSLPLEGEYTGRISTVSSLPSIDRDDFKRFETFKHKKRRFPPIEKTNYYPYETILPKKRKKKVPVEN
jgi:hypothetical protein